MISFSQVARTILMAIVTAKMNYLEFPDTLPWPGREMECTKNTLDTPRKCKQNLFKFMFTHDLLTTVIE